MKSVSSCRQELIQSDLLAYAEGVYQVLELPVVATYKEPIPLSPIRLNSPDTPIKPREVQNSQQNAPSNVEIPECLKKLLEDLS